MRFIKGGGILTRNAILWKMTNFLVVILLFISIFPLISTTVEAACPPGSVCMTEAEAQASPLWWERISSTQCSPGKYCWRQVSFIKNKGNTVDYPATAKAGQMYSCTVRWNEVAPADDDLQGGVNLTDLQGVGGPPKYGSFNIFIPRRTSKPDSATFQFQVPSNATGQMSLCVSGFVLASKIAPRAMPAIDQYCWNVMVEGTTSDKFPSVNQFDVSPRSLPLGSPFTISYTVEDDKGLASVVLWRQYANDQWKQPNSQNISGKLYSGSFSDVPPAPGTYWYGLHVKDNSGQESSEANNENGGKPKIFSVIQVIVESAKKKYNLTINTSGNGTTSPGSGEYNEGDAVNIIATPDSDWEFDYWSGDGYGSGTTRTVVMDGPKSVTAYFKQSRPSPYNLTIQTSGSGSTNPSPGTYSYRQGDTVTIIATADPGWELDGWGGDGYGSGAFHVRIVPMEYGNKSVTAYFKQTQFITLTIKVSGNGSTNPGAGTNSYKKGDAVNIIATPDSGWELDGWDGDGYSPGAFNVRRVEMNGPKSVTANFKQSQTYELIIDVRGNGTTDPKPRTYPVKKGETYDINAFPDPGWVFNSWSGDGYMSGTTRKVLIDGNKRVTAIFEQTKKYKLNKEVKPSQDSGYILDPGEGTYDAGSNINIIAQEKTGWKFDHWGGAAFGTNNTATVVMDSNQTVTAYFITTKVTSPKDIEEHVKQYMSIADLEEGAKRRKYAYLEIGWDVREAYTNESRIIRGGYGFLFWHDYVKEVSDWAEKALKFVSASHPDSILFGALSSISSGFNGASFYSEAIKNLVGQIDKNSRSATYRGTLGYDPAEPVYEAIYYLHESINEEEDLWRSKDFTKLLIFLKQEDSQLKGLINKLDKWNSESWVWKQDEQLLNTANLATKIRTMATSDQELINTLIKLLSLEDLKK